MARLPMAQASSSGVRTSLALTFALVTSEGQLAKIETIDLMSALMTASISCWPGCAAEPLLSGVRNSLASYLLRIQRSLSSRLLCAVGLARCLVFDSQTELARLLPMASITLRCGDLELPGKKYVRIISTFFQLSLSFTYGQSSRPRERTLEMCEPRLRCTPEHSMHMSTPKFKLAHSGSDRNGR